MTIFRVWELWDDPLPEAPKPALRKCDKACVRSIRLAVADAEADVGKDGLTTPLGLLRRRAALSGCRQVPTCRFLGG